MFFEQNIRTSNIAQIENPEIRSDTRPMIFNLWMCVNHLILILTLQFMHMFADFFTISIWYHKEWLYINKLN